MITSPPVRRPRVAGSLVPALRVVRLAVLALLVSAAVTAVAFSQAFPSTATAVLAVVVVAYAAVAGVPLWWVMGRLIGSVAETRQERPERVTALAPVIPLHGWRPQAG